MRIVLDYRPALRERTGVGHYVHELAGAMLAQLRPGESLTLFSSSWKDRLPAERLAGAGRVDRQVPVRVLNALWHRLEWPPIETFTGPVDVAQSAHPLLMPARAAVQAVTVYDLDFLEHAERTRAEVRRDYAALAPRHATRADLVVVISDHTAAQVASRLGVARDRIVICRPGVPSGASPRAMPVVPGPILFVGTIEPRKNLPTLFAAYEQLVATRPSAPPLVLAGRQVEQSPAILAAAATPALEGRVRALGYVSDASRQQLYAAASMLVLPSLEEGFGMTAAEAMQAGVPVVASDRGALPEVIGDAGVLVDAQDAGAWARAMDAVLGDAALRTRLAEAGPIRARRYSWRDSAAVLLDAYRAAVARRQGGS